MARGSRRRAAAPVDTAAIDALAARIASVESKANAPAAPCPVPIRPRPRASRRWRNRWPRCAANSHAVRAQSEKLAAAVNDVEIGAARSASSAGSVRDQRAHRAARTRHARAGRRDRAGQRQDRRQPSRPMTCRCAASWRRPCSTCWSGRAIPMPPRWPRRNRSRTNAGCVEAARSALRPRACRAPHALSRELLTLVPKLSPPAPENRHHRRRHRRPPAGRRGQAGPHRAHRRRRHRPRRHRRAGHRGGAAQRFQRGAARIEHAGAGRSRRRASLARQGRCARRRAGRIPSIRGRRHGRARQTGAIGSRCTGSFCFWC